AQLQSELAQTETSLGQLQTAKTALSAQLNTVQTNIARAQEVIASLTSTINDLTVTSDIVKQRLSQSATTLQLVMTGISSISHDLDVARRLFIERQIRADELHVQLFTLASQLQGA